MSDIVERLRNWRSVHLARLHLLMDEAADEIERLRADWPEQLAAARSEIERLRNGAVEVRETVTCPHVVGKTTLRCSLTPFTLTDEEREAVCMAMNAYGENNADQECAKIEATLWGLLSRTGTNDAKTGDDATECPSQGEKLPERERLTMKYIRADSAAATLRALLERTK